MNAKDFLAETPPLGPSAHQRTPLPERIARYRRVLGTLRLSERAPELLTWRQRFELRAALREAMLLSGSFVENPKEQIRLMGLLLEQVLDAQLRARNEASKLAGMGEVTACPPADPAA